MSVSVRLLLALLALVASPCLADSWLPAKSETYLSPDKTYRVRVVPREIESALAYFSDKVHKREPAGGPKGQRQTRATATIEHLSPDGTWVKTWSGSLTNEVAPVFVLIADGGHYLVTFDNWHSMGYGPNVVAIHDDQGRLIRTLSLNDVVSDEYVSALRHSVSSIWWRGEPHFGPGDTLIIPIVVPQETRDGDSETYVDAVFRLSDGALLNKASPDWQSAQASAAHVAQLKRAYDEEAKQAFIAPLLGPKENTELAWHGYLREAFYRSTPNWREDSTSTTVLRDPADPEYAASEGWVRDALLSLDYEHGTMSFASIAPFDFFVARLKTILAEAKPGKLKGSKVYVVAPIGALPMFKAMFAKTGAQVFVFDPQIPIPQRQDRLNQYLSAR